MFHDTSLLGRCFRDFVLPLLDNGSADTHLKLSDRAVSGTRFLTVVFECDIAHRRSVALLFILYKIRCNPMHPLNDALPGLYVPVRVNRGALVAHRYTYAQPRCRTKEDHLWQNLAVPHAIYSPLSVSLERSCLPCIRWCGTGGFQEQCQCLVIGLSCSTPTI